MSWDSSSMARIDGEFDVQELQRDLARKYRNVGGQVDSIWKAFGPKQRKQSMKQSTGDGRVLQHNRDPRLGVLFNYIPEYNLRDMTTKPEHFLNIFKFRALTSLEVQLYEGANGLPGDRELMENTGLRYAYASKGERTIFNDGQHYGRSFISAETTEELYHQISPAVINSVIIPRAIGQLILYRQQFLFQFLNHIVEEILDIGSKTRVKDVPEKSVNEALVTATSNLSIRPEPLKSSLIEVRVQATESNAALEDYLHLLRSEPVVLNHAINTTYWSRTELVPDERGRILPAMTDRHLSAALFDTFTTTFKGIAVWDYIRHLLQLLDESDKVKQGLILQELSNACHLEYRRAQKNLKREVAPQTHVACKGFKRITNQASGQSKIVMKGQPADHTVSDPQLDYILRLCHPDTSPVTAVQWIQEMDDHNSRHDEDMKRLCEAEMSALGNVVIIVSFMHMMSTAISVVPVSRKSGLLFTARSTELENELNNLKSKADFGDYLVPMNNLLEPRMARDALNALDDFVSQETGAPLGSLYANVVQGSLENLEKIYVEAKAKLQPSTTYVPFPTEPSASRKTQLEQRKVKEKTRPAGSSVYAISSPPPQQPVIAESAQQFHVKATTVSMFTTLFSKSEAHGSLSWTCFEAAMADLGFSVTPKGGSVFTFNPPVSMETRPITLHRPHVSEIEGYKLLFLRRRLQRVYGWTVNSFVVA